MLNFIDLLFQQLYIIINSISFMLLMLFILIISFIFHFIYPSYQIIKVKILNKLQHQK